MSASSPLRIAIATPTVNAWSETFIAAHVLRLQGVELILSDGDLPNRVVDGPLLLARDLMGRMLDHVKAAMRGGGTQDLLRSRIVRLLRERRMDVVLAEYGPCAQALAEPLVLITRDAAVASYSSSFLKVG